jgi:predicted phosphodiesterase
MRVLLISDIHANWPALQTLEEPHDLCVCLGDVVDYGLEPGPCVDWVRRLAHYTVRGNHDHGAAQNVVVSAPRGFKYLTGVTRPLTRQLLRSEDLRFLARMPVTVTLTIDGLCYLFVHATPRDPLEEFAPGAVDFWSRCLDGVDADVICVGHTHQPYILEVGDKLVVNPGSVGQPRDGDPRGGYAVIEGNEVELKRFEYPVEEAVKKVEASSLPDRAKELLIQVYRTGSSKNQTNGARRSE